MIDALLFILFFILVAIGGYLIRPREERIYKIDGYTIRYNPYYKTWQTSHLVVGVCEEFKTLKEAKQYCRKG